MPSAEGLAGQTPRIASRRDSNAHGPIKPGRRTHKQAPRDSAPAEARNRLKTAPKIPTNKLLPQPTVQQVNGLVKASNPANRRAKANKVVRGNRTANNPVRANLTKELPRIPPTPPAERGPGKTAATLNL